MSGARATFDLGAERRKRGSGAKELVITGEDGEVEFRADVRPEMAADLLDFGSQGLLGKAFRELFVDAAAAETFMATYHPSVDDLGAALKQLYGADELGESLASGNSSTNGGKKQRPTSGGTTRKRSPKR